MNQQPSRQALIQRALTLCNEAERRVAPARPQPQPQPTPSAEPSRRVDSRLGRGASR